MSTRINNDLEEKQMVVQSYQNIFNSYNESMHRRQKYKQKLLDQLNECKTQYRNEAEYINKRNLNDSFEKVEYLTENIKNEIMIIDENNSCLK